MEQQKLPPHDIDAEEAVIGSVLINPDAFIQAAPIVSTADFYTERGSWCWEAMKRLADRDEAIDQITVANELNNMGKLEDVGGAAYLTHLVSVVPTSLDAEAHARIVARCSQARKLIQRAGQIAELGYKAGADIEKALSDNPKAYPIDLTIGDSKIVMANPDEKGQTELTADTDGQGFVRIDGQYLAEALRACGGMAEFKLSNSYSPTLFSADGYQLVVMPMLTDKANEQQRAEAKAKAEKPAEQQPEATEKPKGKGKGKAEPVAEPVAEKPKGKPKQAKQPIKA